MARDQNPFDNDYDGNPGGRGFSREFARRYDPQGEQEYTNLPLNLAQLEAAEVERQDEEAHALMLEQMNTSASARIHFWPTVGKFVIPRENSFAAHLQLVQGGKNVDLHFDPATYKFFDRVIAETAARPDIFDPSHPQYARYAPLRDNLAVLRNDIMGIYMDDGSFDPGDEKYIPQLVSIATELGQAINYEKRFLPRLFAPSLNTELLNMEGDGAAYAYRHLVKRQSGGGILDTIVNTLRDWLNMPLASWQLPPVEATPFSEDGLNALPPVDALCMTHEQLQNYCRSLNQQPVLAQAAVMEQARQDAPPVEESLGHVQKRETIDLGITILRWFKDIKFSDKSVMELMDTGTPAEKAEMVGVVAKFVQYYQQITARAVQRDPSLANREEIRKADKAAKVLSHSIELLAKLEKPSSIAQTQQIGSDVTRQPEHWDELKGDTVDRLMTTLKGGLESAVSAFEQQEQDQEQAQEESMESALEAALSELQRRKKRRRKQQTSGLGGKKQQKVDLALRADDRAAGQGIYAQVGNLKEQRAARQENFRESLQVRDMGELKDIDLVKSLGKALSGAARDGQALEAKDGKDKDGMEGGGLAGFSMANVDPNAKITPDNQDVASKIIGDRKRESAKPKKQGK